MYSLHQIKHSKNILSSLWVVSRLCIRLQWLRMQKNQHPYIMHWGCNNKIQSQFYTFDHMTRLGFRKRLFIGGAMPLFLSRICIGYHLCVHSNFRTNHHHSWWLGTTYKIWFPNQLDMPSKILPRKAQVCHLVSRRKSKYIKLN